MGATFVSISRILSSELQVYDIYLIFIYEVIDRDLKQDLRSSTRSVKRWLV